MLRVTSSSAIGTMYDDDVFIEYLWVCVCARLLGALSREMRIVHAACRDGRM